MAPGPLNNPWVDQLNISSGCGVGETLGAEMHRIHPDHPWAKWLWACHFAFLRQFCPLQTRPEFLFFQFIDLWWKLQSSLPALCPFSLPLVPHLISKRHPAHSDLQFWTVVWGSWPNLCSSVRSEACLTNQSPELPMVTVIGSGMGLWSNHSQLTFILEVWLTETGRNDSLFFLLGKSLGEWEFGALRHHQVSGESTWSLSKWKAEQTKGREAQTSASVICTFSPRLPENQTIPRLLRNISQFIYM